jgi:Ni/Co efflux regulator RcnB
MRRTVGLVLSLFLALSGAAFAAPSGQGRPTQPTTRPSGPLKSQPVNPSKPHRPHHRPPHYYRPGSGHHWHKGNHLYHWSRYRHVAWHRYAFLHRPPAGYYWVEVDGRYLLVAAATGIIMSVVLGR